MTVTGIFRSYVIDYTHKGMHLEDVIFDNNFWKIVVEKLGYFYKQYYLPQLHR